MLSRKSRDLQRCLEASFTRTSHASHKHTGIKAKDNKRHTRPQPGQFYRENDRSPTARHRIRNEKRARNQREFHYTSSDVLSDITRAYQSVQIHSYLSHTAVLARGLIGTCVGPNPLQSSQLLPIKRVMSSSRLL